MTMAILESMLLMLMVVNLREAFEAILQGIQ